MFDPAYQTCANGPLTEALRARIIHAKQAHGFSNRAFGWRVGLSASLIAMLLNAEKPYRLRSVHVPRILEQLDLLERMEASWTAEPAPHARAAADPGRAEAARGPEGGDDLLLSLIERANALGFAVTFTRIASAAAA